MAALTDHTTQVTEVAQHLAHADINIEYAYCTAIDRQGTGCLILKTKELERTIEILSTLERG